MVVTHEMGFAREVAERIFFMHYGAILEEAPPGGVFPQPPPGADATISERGAFAHARTALIAAPDLTGGRRAVNFRMGKR